jgi:hypothetical protein
MRRTYRRFGWPSNWIHLAIDNSDSAPANTGSRGTPKLMERMFRLITSMATALDRHSTALTIWLRWHTITAFSLGARRTRTVVASCI